MIMKNTSKSNSSRTAWLHSNHVLSKSQGQLDQLEDGFTHFLQGVDAGCEGDEEDVQPGDEEAHRPG